MQFLYRHSHHLEEFWSMEKAKTKIGIITLMLYMGNSYKKLLYKVVSELGTEDQFFRIPF